MKLENEENSPPPRVVGEIFYFSTDRSRPGFVSSILALAQHIEKADADRLYREVIRSLLTRLRAPDDSMMPLLSRLDPFIAGALAREFALQACAGNDLNRDGLNVILTDWGRTALKFFVERPENGVSETHGCRLQTQELVELLKMPTCFGNARRLVLDHLGNRYRRRFVNHWAFVRFAEEQKLGLDFTTPPKRPNPEESVKRTQNP